MKKGSTSRIEYHASPYVIVVTTALVTLLVAVLGWMLLELREVRRSRELTEVAVERANTARARAQDLENQIKALRREQNLQNELMHRFTDLQQMRGER